MKPILFTCFIILVFASCTGRRYGHYGYVKKGEKKSVVKPEKKKLLPGATLAAKLPVANNAVMQVDTQPAKTPAAHRRQTIKTVNRENKHRQPYYTQKENATVTKKSLADKVNSFAVISFLFALLAVLFIIIAIINGVFAVNLILAALLLLFSSLIGRYARKEIDEGKGKGRGLSLVGVYISAAIGILLILFAILLALLITASIVFFIIAMTI